jgi:hypothetical protein
MKTTTIVWIALLACVVLAPVALAEGGDVTMTEDGSGTVKCVSVTGDPSNPIDVYDCPNP